MRRRIHTLVWSLPGRSGLSLGCFASAILTHGRGCLLALLLFVNPLAAAVPIQELSAASLSVKAWQGSRFRQVSGIVVQSDPYNGYVLTGSEGIKNSDRLTIQVSGGAELTAEVVNISSRLALALLKANGLRHPVMVFDQSTRSGGEAAWVGALNHAEGVSSQFVSPAVISGVSVRGGDQLLSLRSIGEPLPANNGALVNECGQLMGFVPGPDATAIATVSVLGFLNELNLRPKLAADHCVSAVQRAKDTADAANRAADIARSEAQEAQAIAQQLAQQLVASDQQNQLLKRQAAKAQEAADQAIEAASTAQRHADETRLELEKQTSALAAETEAMVDQIRRDREAAEQRFRDALIEERQQSTYRENLLLGGLVLIVVLVLAGLLVMQRLGLWRPTTLTGVQTDAEAQAVKNQPLPLNQAGRQEDHQEFVFEGRDEEGIRYLLRISQSQLGSGGIVIGRESQHSINHVDVSRQHARMSLKHGQVFIEDLASTNGTSVNGETIDNKGPVAVTNGDQVIFGSVMMNLRMLA